MPQTPKFPLKERVLRFLASHPNEEFKQKVLARRLSINDDNEYHTLVRLLKELHESGAVDRGKGKRYRHTVRQTSQHLTGIFRAERNGSGVVRLLPPASGSIVIPERFTATAFDGDTVSLVVFTSRDHPEPAGEPPEGEITGVIRRSSQPVVGTFEKGKNFFFLVPDSRKFGRAIYVPSGKTLGARPGDKAVAIIDAWESKSLNPEGHVVELLGKSGDVHAEMKSVAREFRLSLEFPRDVLLETRSIPETIPDEEIKNRIDLRHIACFTIDPEDAKDFDDAISLERIGGDSYRVGIHIADVSHYVKEGSSLDAEALRRGTSVYLANEVIPMLPEKLSNNICSLRPNEDRLTYSVLVEISAAGKVGSYDIRKSVIHSKRRFTYEEVQSIIDSGDGDYTEELNVLHKMSKFLLKKRLADGALDFDTTEVKFRFDRSGKPTEIFKKTRLGAHRLVEEFMLLANQIVASHIKTPRGEGETAPFIYRIHDSPPPEKLKDFRAFVQHLGYAVGTENSMTSRSLQRLLKDIQGTEEENVINEVAIRSMSKAVYSETNIGHYGLAMKHYTHFTSPIRRYPDLQVHRLLHEYSKKMSLQRRRYYENVLPDICAQSTERERVAQEAERASVKVMQVEYMKRHLGDQFHALISGVVKFGLFVEITDLLVEGFVHVRDLEDDYYSYDPLQFSLTGRTNHRRYRLGDKVTIQVVRVDPEEREIDFRLMNADEHPVRRKLPHKQGYRGNQ